MNLELNVVRFESDDIMTASHTVEFVSHTNARNSSKHYHVKVDGEFVKVAGISFVVNSEQIVTISGDNCVSTKDSLDLYDLPVVKSGGRDYIATENDSGQYTFDGNNTYTKK